MKGACVRHWSVSSWRKILQKTARLEICFDVREKGRRFEKRRCVLISFEIRVSDLICSTSLIQGFHNPCGDFVYDFPSLIASTATGGKCNYFRNASIDNGGYSVVYGRWSGGGDVGGPCNECIAYCIYDYRLATAGYVCRRAPWHFH